MWATGEDRMKPAALLAAILCAATPSHAEEARRASPFAQRGYYITFMRMPTYDLTDWKEIIDGIHDDGGNFLLFWVGGGFRSKKFPVTWQYNQDHANVRDDFVRELIDHAHARGIKVLLGFTPFGYDGVNQFSVEHPELKAISKNGNPVDKAGIGCWGYNLCPSRPESQKFMLDYVREMAFDFYPNADGLMIESSDYAICHCKDCGPRFFEREFDFVRRISAEVWEKKPEAMVIVYPHYFSGSEVPGFGVRAAKQPFDPRWTVFFTPHSAHLDPALIRQARSSLWWDDSPALRGPREIQAGAQRALKAGVTGYVPSLEAYSFVATEAEEGQSWLKGLRQVPHGMGWLAEDTHPYNELPLRINRIAYREFSRDPALPFERFKETLGREILGEQAADQAVDDLLKLQQIFATERTWCQAAPLLSPDRVLAWNAQGRLSPDKKAALRGALEQVRLMELRHRDGQSAGERELHRICAWILKQWDKSRESLIAPGR